MKKIFLVLVISFSVLALKAQNLYIIFDKTDQKQFKFPREIPNSYYYSFNYKVYEGGTLRLISKHGEEVKVLPISEITNYPVQNIQDIYELVKNWDKEDWAIINSKYPNATWDDNLTQEQLMDYWYLKNNTRQYKYFIEKKLFIVEIDNENQKIIISPVMIESMPD